jgi:hypothetical protein
VIASHSLSLLRAVSTIDAVLATTSDLDVVALVMPALPASAGCLSQGLVRATSSNVAALRALLGQLTPLTACGLLATRTNYTSAFADAFAILDATTTLASGNATQPVLGSGDCAAAIVIVTADASVFASDVQTAFSLDAGRAQARLFVYTIGTANATASVDAAAAAAVCAIPPASSGDAVTVPPSGNLVDALGSFFRISATSIGGLGGQTVDWSAPQSDPDVGAVVPATTPVYVAQDNMSMTSGALLGVVSVDVSVSAIAAKLLAVPQSKNGNSYAFLLDLQGRVLAHPLCNANGAHVSMCIGVDISQLEVCAWW